MTNKFLDIIPPGAPKRSWVPAAKRSSLPSSPNYLKEGIIIFALIFIGLSLLCHFVFCRAEVKIWPQTESLEFKETIIVDMAGEFDLSAQTIPGQFFEKVQKNQQEFFASEIFNKEEKASGTIKVFNEQNPPRSLSLIAGTRFLSSDSEKYFTSPKKIYIPAAKMKDGKIVPQWTAVEIVAMETGPDYNIGPTKFSIPGLVGTSFYYTTWGESDGNMSGGADLETKRVSQKDLDDAEKVLSERLLTEIESDLKNSIPSEFILLNDAFAKEIVDTTCLAPVEAEVESFVYEAEAQAAAMVFKKTYLQQFAEEYILAQIPVAAGSEIFSGQKKILPESLKISYEIEDIDMENGQIVLNLEFFGQVYPDIDASVLKQAFQGKTIFEIKTFLENQPQIIRSEVKFWPFWIQKAPDDTEKIKTELNFNPY